LENSINIYATIVQGRYALRALALHESMNKHLKNKILIILCVDDIAWQLLSNLELSNCRIVHIRSFETSILEKLKFERSIAEYCWTCKPFVLEFIFAEYKNASWGIYLDSDTMVFGDPDKGLPKDLESHVLLTPHRPTDNYFLQHIKTAGTYNAGYIAFRNSDQGREVLLWWKEKCIEACPMVPRDGIYGDQYYLNYMPEFFEGIIISTNKGLNAAPWNISGQMVTKYDERTFIEDDELLTYDMQGVEIITKKIINYYKGNYVLSRDIKNSIYRPYALLISKAWEKIVKNLDGKVNLSDVNEINVRFIVRNFLKIMNRKSNLQISILEQEKISG
jgi:hypothetical protein